MRSDGFPFPVELSKLWGLNRGQFCGLLLTNNPAEVRQALTGMERSLHDAWHRKVLSEQPRKTRWWLTLQPEKQPNGILHPNDLADCIAEEEFAQYMRQDGVAPDILLGLLMIRAANEVNVSNIRQWLRGLFHSEFGQHQTALIILIEDTPTDESLNRVNRYVRELSGMVPDGFPVQAFFAMPNLTASTDQLQTTPVKVHLSNLLRQHTWMESSADNAPLSDRLTEYLDTLTQVHGAQPGLRSVVKFLEAKDAASKCVDDLLVLVQRYDMGKMPDLMFYLAQSKYAYNAIKLVFQWHLTHHRADAWLDAWLEGMEAGAPNRIDEAQLDTALSDWITLGLIRVRAQVRTLLGQQLRALQPMLSRDMQRLYEYIVEEGDPSDYFDNVPTTALHVLASSGRGDAIPLNILQSAPLDDTDLWYTFFALPPSTEENDGLLHSLDVTRRVVVGLCSSLEWEHHQDKLIQEQITACRRGNRLFFAKGQSG